MIEGLKIDIPSVELVEHLTERATFHLERGKFYREQAKAIGERGDIIADVTNDPQRNLNQSGKTHEERYAFFRFLAEHVVPSETYRLNESDLARIELLSRYL